MKCATHTQDWLQYLLLLLQLLVEGISFGLGCVEFLLGCLQLFLPLCLSILHLVLQHLVLFFSPFLHLFGDAQSLLTVLWLSQYTTNKLVQTSAWVETLISVHFR